MFWTISFDDSILDEVSSILARIRSSSDLRFVSNTMCWYCSVGRLRKTIFTIEKSKKTNDRSIFRRNFFCFFLQIGSLSETDLNVRNSTSSMTAIDDGLSLSTINSINDDEQTRLVIQYHYTRWKDMDVPTDSHTLLHLIREVNEQTAPEQYPIVVHCT